MEKLYRTHYVSKTGKKAPAKPAAAEVSEMDEFDWLVDWTADGQVGEFVPDPDTDEDVPF